MRSYILSFNKHTVTHRAYKVSIYLCLLLYLCSLFCFHTNWKVQIRKTEVVSKFGLLVSKLKGQSKRTLAMQG